MGIYTFTYTAITADGQTSTATVTVNVNDSDVERPIADAGEIQDVFVNSTVTLNGSQSYDQNEHESLEFYWTFIETPEGNQAELSSANTVSPSFFADVPGEYFLQLVVRNTQGAMSDLATVEIRVHRKVEVPNIIGLISSGKVGCDVIICDDVHGKLYSQGLHVGRIIRTESDRTIGEVLGQEPAPGEMVFEDSPVNFVISEGQLLAVVPDVVGIQLAIARNMIEEVGFVVGDVEMVIDTSLPEQTVLNSDPEAGLYRTAGTAIALRVSTGGAEPNKGPEIISSPTYSAKVGELYTYAVQATDPNNDPLSFSLPTAPQGMSINAQSGQISWTPSAGQLGEHAVKVIVEDGRGAGASQSFSVYVNSASVNPPQITSTPLFSSRVEQEYVYDVKATDADGDTLNYSLSIAPDGMSIDPVSGHLSWTPQLGRDGIYDITIIVEDGQGGIGGQQYSLTILPPNEPPTVSLTQPAQGCKVEEGRTLTLRAQADDSDGTIASIEFYADGVSAGTPSGDYALDWIAGDLGEHTFYAIATDHEGAATQSQTVTVTVIEPLPDTIAPLVEVFAAPQQVMPDETVNIQITITDASPIETITLDINGTPLDISDNHASYTVPANGFYTVTAQAIDSAGNSGSGSVVFRAFDGVDNTPPALDLHDDVELNCIELKADLYDIIGSVSDDNDVHYKLQTREKGVDIWDTLLEGTGSDISGILAGFDPTIYRNGLHEVRLWAEDLAGNVSTLDGCLLLNGRFKVGQAGIGGIDFNIPELGSPLLLGRVYDSRNRHDGSFGPGWSLPHEASNVQAEYTYTPHEGWGEEFRGSWPATYYVISRTRKVLALRLGDGAVFKFRMELSPKSSLLNPIMDASFPMNVLYTPLDDTKGSLEPIGIGNQVFLLSEYGGTLVDWKGSRYNPTRFKLTLEDGTVYIIDQQSGIESITDPYGHKIDYSDSGISHSSGDVLSIERDTSNRIERVKDQLGRTIEYRYDENGMLEQVIQQGEGPYAMKVLEHYAYQEGVVEQPVLKDIFAPDGTRLGTFEYDSQGRKTGLIDHEGNRVLFGYDAPEHHYTVNDRRGNPTEYTYDSEGNVTAVTDAEGHTERYTYDAKGNVLSKTNKLGYSNSFVYDADGNVLQETDALGNTVSFTYDDAGNKLSATDPLGNTTEYTYDAHGNPLTQKDALGRVTTFAYDADGNLKSSTNALDQTTLFTYDDQGNMLSKTDPLGHSVELSYDLYGNVIESKDEMGNITQKAYDPQGNMVKTVDALGHETHMQYDHTGKVTSYIDKAGNETVNAFNPAGNLTSNTDAAGNTFHFNYDENENQTLTVSSITTANGVETVELQKVYDRLNRVTEQVDADGLSTKAEYDALGRQTATTDKLGNRSQIAYDPRNLPLRSTAPDGKTEENSYDAAGRLKSKTDHKGRSVLYGYDKVGNVKKTVNPNGTWVENEYDELNRLVGTTSSTGLSTGRKYDKAGRLIEETDVLGRATKYEYYADGKRKKMIDPRGNEFEFAYDVRGNQTEMRFPDGTQISYIYNKQGKKIVETDQLGHTTGFEWNKLGLLKKLSDHLSHETSYEYNEIGNLLSQTDANQHTTRFEYNKLGRRVKKTYPLGMFQTTEYDVNNRRVSITDYNGRTIVSEYDSQGRLTTTFLPGGAEIRYFYTAAGLLDHVTDLRGTTRYEYDGEDRLIRRSDPDGRSIAYTYDALGRKKSVTVPSGSTEYGYDEYGRLKSVTAADGTTSYKYDTHGNKERVTYPNGVVTEYGYDNLNRLEYVEQHSPGGDLLAAYSYTLNAKGMRAKAQESSGRVVEYRYDELDRLIEENITEADGSTRLISYSFDPVGNRLSKTECTDAQPCVSTTYQYDDNDRLLTEGAYTYTYDNNGNLRGKTGNGESYGYDYNALNQLIQAQINTPHTSATFAYDYDHDGIRVGKTINGSEQISYLVDKHRPYAQVLEEIHSQGTLNRVTNYVYGDDLLSRNVNGAPEYYLYDGMGSVRGLSDAAGSVSDTYRYDAYGQLSAQSGESGNAYLYRGEQYDPELDAYYLRARYYQPGNGRFLATDPVEGVPFAPLTLHRYVYGNNNPVKYLDPSGEMSFDELLVTTAILNIVSGIAVESNFMGMQDVYVLLAECLFPDAYICGLNVNLPRAVISRLHYLNYILPYGISIPKINLTTDIWGYELLFNISSAEIALFQVRGINLISLPIYYGGSVYEGSVWNLWNAQNYSGAFISGGLFGGSLFFSPGDMFMGPWGIGRDIFSRSAIKFTRNSSGTATHYTLVGQPWTGETEGEILAALIPVNCFINSLKLSLTKNILYTATYWIQTATAKYYWNKKSKNSVLQRQLRGRPLEFQSGPGLVLLGQYF